MINTTSGSAKEMFQVGGASFYDPRRIKVLYASVGGNASGSYYSTFRLMNTPTGAGFLFDDAEAILLGVQAFGGFSVAGLWGLYLTENDIGINNLYSPVLPDIALGPNDLSGSSYGWLSVGSTQERFLNVSPALIGSYYLTIQVNNTQSPNFVASALAYVYQP